MSIPLNCNTNTPKKVLDRKFGKIVERENTKEGEETGEGVCEKITAIKSPCNDKIEAYNTSYVGLSNTFSNHFQKHCKMS